jgi:hypothetical protein
MSTFTWRILLMFMLLFLMLAIATITVTLIVVFDIRNGTPIDQSQLMFVEVSNFIFASILFLGFMTALIGTPVLLYFQKRNNRWIETGLRPANEPKKS